MQGSSTKPKSATSYKHTSFGIIPRDQLIALESQGVKQALDYILKLNKQKVSITPNLILDIHREAFGFIFPTWAGKYRTIEVTVGDYIPPFSHEVPVLINNLTKDLAERLKFLPSSSQQEKFIIEVVSLLAWFQNRFVWIHPFNDYNGRVARLLTNLLSLNLGLPLFEIKADTKKDRDVYIEAMKLADKQDYAQLEKLMSTALQESLEKI